MPPALQNWLPEGDLAWFILDAVAQMDLTKIERAYRADGWGQAAYEPAMRVALLLYAYCLGERSSRRIERRCERDVAYRVLAANQQPDHTTIARFRQTHEAALAALFTQVLTRCAAAGLVKVGLVALDGTKIKADAALAANRTAETIAAEVTRMLTEAQATDAAEDRLYGPEQRGDELPDALRDRRSRSARLKACQERLEREAAEAVAQQQAKLEARRAEEAATGQNKRGTQAEGGRDGSGGHGQGERDGPGEPHHEDTGRVRPRLQCPGRRDGGADHFRGRGHARGERCPATASDAEAGAGESAGLRAPAGHQDRLADAGSCSEANLTEADPAGPRPADRPEQRPETAPGAARAATATRPLSEGADGPRSHGAHVADEARTPSV
jgi:transposase